jgi:hypothetical protein
MTRKLLTDEHAARYTPGAPYRPSNGSEGDYFQAKWCDDCQHCGDVGLGAWGCKKEIDLMSMAYEIGEPGYPPEWIYGPDGQPMCTAHQRENAVPEWGDGIPINVMAEFMGSGERREGER